MRRWLLCLALVGCHRGAGDAWSARHTPGPDGSDDWWAIECRYRKSDCRVLAGRVCPEGYTVVESENLQHQESQAGASQVGGTTFMQASSRGFTGASMFIHCGAPPVQPRAARPAPSPPEPASTALPTRAFPE